MACIGLPGGGLLVNRTTRTRSYCPASIGTSISISTSTSLNREKKLNRRVSTVVVIRAESMATEKLGIKIEKNPPESKLTQLGVRNWPKWGCPPSKFPWTYDAKETCYLLEGKVKVTPAGSTESVEIGAGDFVEFPKGMSCTWDVSVAVDKHYNFS